jgi:hypothetical protein
MFIPDPGSDFFPSWIPDPNFLHPGSRILIKEFKYFNPKKWFLSSRKYDPGCSSRIRIPESDPDFLPIPDPGSRGQKGTGSVTLVGIMSSLPLPPQASVSPLLNPKGGEQHSRAGERVGGPSSNDWTESLALSILS